MYHIRVNDAGFIQIPADWSLTPARTREWPDLDLWYLQKGQLTFESREGKYRIYPGACLFLRGGEDYCFYAETGEIIQHYWIHYDILDDKEIPLSPKEAILPEQYRQISDTHMIEQLLNRLVKNLMNRSAQRLTSVWMEAILAEIEFCDQISRGQSSKKGVTVNSWISGLCHQIDRNPQKTWEIENMARKTGYSRSYLYRKFHELTGLGPQEYVIAARMRMARYLLRESNNSITWIADQLGYGDIFYFSRQYKSFHGLSPVQYRNCQDKENSRAGCPPVRKKDLPDLLPENRPLP